jgi:hypothetical protein
MGPKVIFGKICSITSASVKGGNTCFGYFLRFSWLWGHFEGLEFGVQGTTFGLCGGENRFLIFGKKTRCFVLVLKVQNQFVLRSLLANH